MGSEFQFEKWEVQEIDDGESYTAMWMYFVPLKCTGKYG